MAGELDVDRLAEEIPARLMMDWAEYLRWQSGDTGKGKMIRDPAEQYRQALQRWGSR